MNKDFDASLAAETLRRISAATPSSTNSATASDAFTWCHAVVDTALASLVPAWLSIDVDGQRDATVRADRAEEWQRYGRRIVALVPAPPEAEPVAWLSVAIDGQQDATVRLDRADDFRRFGRTITPLVTLDSLAMAGKPYCWVRENPGHFDPCHGGEQPSTEFLPAPTPGAFPLFRGARKDFVESHHVALTSEPPPLPYTLSELQKVCAEKLGLTAAKTREVALDLYSELKVITYPLSDCGYLPNYLRKDVPTIMASLRTTPGMEVAAFESNVCLVSPAWDAVKLHAQSHHGIIPTTEYTSAKRKEMKPVERDVFDLIAWNFIAQFYPDCVRRTVTAKVGIDGDLLETTASKIIENGWRDVLDVEAGDGMPPDRLNERALEAARRAYEAKERDAFGPTPTEHPDDGGGPLGYAIRAYLNALKA